MRFNARIAATSLPDSCSIFASSKLARTQLLFQLLFILSAFLNNFEARAGSPCL